MICDICLCKVIEEVTRKETISNMTFDLLTPKTNRPFPQMVYYKYTKFKVLGKRLLRFIEAQTDRHSDGPSSCDYYRAWHDTNVGP